jgi:hypothetical protein
LVVCCGVRGFKVGGGELSRMRIRIAGHSPSSRRRLFFDRAPIDSPRPRLSQDAAVEPIDPLVVDILNRDDLRGRV